MGKEKLKKLWSTFVIVLITFLFFTACGNTDKQLTKKDFLKDFDYMMETMEDTFPYFGVAERRLGVDIRELGRETRAMIESYPHSLEGLANELGISLEDMPDLDEHIFWSIIRHEFFSHFMGFAHSLPLDFRLYNAFRPSYINPMSPFYSPDSNNFRAFTNPVSQKIYQEQEALFKTPAEERGALFQLVFRPRPSVVEPPRPLNTVNTEIIEEDRIAYLNVSNFTDLSPNTIADLRRSYKDVQRYEHLIIDIRDNRGGSVDFWRMLIMKPLWSDMKDMPDMPLYTFYRGSELGKSLGEDNLQIESEYSRYKPKTDHLLTVEEIMEAYDLPHINEADVQDLSYGVRFNASLSSIEEEHLQQMRIPNFSYPFNGKIWLLTDRNNVSAAALFARHAKEMGFATLVGEQTGGEYTTYVGAYFTLPNTGIILRWDIDYLTDSVGRALEEFPTTPHHYNRPGMDALETVLQLIEEGSY